jgi:prepilin-type N-terminal cleavage/methylation domain-containing protein/prepilin-type processing-associated H-X9-DG protein
MTNSSGRPATNSRAFTLVELLVVIAIIGILVALLLPAIQAAREAARRSQCQSNIHNVALAVLNYESSKKILPPGMTFDRAQGGNVHTLARYGPNWIIHILPYMEEQGLRDSFDPKVFQNFAVAINEPGAGNANVKARGQIIASMLCPSDPFNRTLYQGHGGNYARTNYAASAGRAFIYGAIPNPPSGTPSKDDRMAGPDPPNNNGWIDACQRGVMGPNVAAALKRITDGTTKTIMLGEIRSGPTENDGRGVWALGHAGSSLLAKYGSKGDANGPNYCDIHADDVYSDICASASGACTITGANPIAQIECMGCSGGGGFDQATIRSKHPGGANMAMADGSVQWIADDIETSGCYGGCCTAWDYMIASADEGRPGALNSSSLNVPCKN